MKFCKNLQRVVDISDPEWAPYWTNYKMLKKLIKELPSLVPSDESRLARSAGDNAAGFGGRSRRPDSPSSVESSSVGSTTSGARQQHGDKTTEAKRAAAAAASNNTSSHLRHDAETIGKSPGEVAFFKLLHAEFKKASHFFDRAQQEFLIREERVREGMEIMKQPNSIMVTEKWSLLAKSIYRLYKDLLLLETFAIMTYCSFSKILKKHDKVTGYDTRNAFMANIVNKANFTNYPKVLEMISRCERLYEEVSENLLREGKEGLYEDERLFINMIHRLNEQVLGTAEAEGGERIEAPKRPQVQMQNRPANLNESVATSSLRSLVQEIDARCMAAQVSEGQHGECDESDDDCPSNMPSLTGKRSATEVASAASLMPAPNTKRQRPS